MSIVLLPDKPILSFDEYLSTQVGGKAIEKAHEIGGGLHEKHSIKAVFSGVSNEVNMPNDLDVKLDYEDFKARGSSLGPVGFIVYDDATCMVDITYLFSRSLSVELCGQCPPCKIGSTTSTDHLENIRNGKGARGFIHKEES